jgi:hypothetical protein
MANRLDIDLMGKAVLIQAHLLKPEFDPAARRVFLVTGGFGAKPQARGTALYGTFVADGEHCRMEGWQVDRLATFDEIVEAKALRDRFVQGQAAGTWKSYSS